MNTGKAISAQFAIVCKQSSKEREREREGEERTVREKSR
jgi:hypothetical protein